MRRNGLILRHTSEELRADKDVVLEAVTNEGMALEYASEAMRDVQEVVLAAVSQCGAALMFASTRLRDSDRVLDAAVRQDPLALEYAAPRWYDSPPETHPDKELVLGAVARDGRALAFAGELRRDKDIVIAACMQHGTALMDASAQMRDDREVALAAVTQDGQALLSVSAFLRESREVVRTAVAQCGLALAHAPSELLHDHEIIAVALAQNGMALMYVPPELRLDRRIVQVAVAQCGMALQYAPYALRGDSEIALAAVGQNVEALEHVAMELKLDEDFLAFATHPNPEIEAVLHAKPAPLARKLTVAKARRHLEPEVKKLGLDWEEVFPIIRSVSPLSEFQSALTQPQAFVESLSSRGAGISKRWNITRARPTLEPKLKDMGIAWLDMVRVMEAWPREEELETACQPAAKFIESVRGKRTGQVATLWTIARLRQRLEPLLPKGLPWSDLPPALLAIETLKELQSFLDTPELLIWKLQHGGEWPAAQEFAMLQLRTSMEPLLPPEVHWEDFFEVLRSIAPSPDWRDSLEAACENLPKYLQRLSQNPQLLAAKKWALAQLRPKLEAGLFKQGNTWSEVLPILHEMDTWDDLHKGRDEPGRILAMVAAGPGGD